ncbi:hypothetical protein HanRHA438_Chr13g0618911 [Helianthus annuus]|nr:hypothetical protein HanRHA438_Chr13g0618911 [Helianthus annuus]
MGLKDRSVITISIYVKKNEVMYASKFRHLDSETRASKHMIKTYAMKWKE